MDLIVFIVLIGLVIFICKDLKSFVYFIGIFDLILKLLHLIKVQVSVVELTTLIDTYLPHSVLDIVSKYATGIFSDVLTWLYIACMIMFIFYLIKYFFQHK